MTTFNMAGPTKELHLSVIDQTLCRQYIQNLQIFPFPEISFAEAALQHLHARLSLTIQELPLLTGTVMVHDLSTGILKVTYRDPPCSD